MRKVVLLSVVLGSLCAAPAADAAITDVFGGDVSCSVAADGVRECGNTSPRSTTASFDGVPIDVNVAFPAVSGGEDDYPLMMVFHGYGGGKIGFGTSGQTNGLRRWTSRGYAVFTMTDRGFHESCGSAASRTFAGSACDPGYVRLIDTRYEPRDAQFLAGELADEELIDPDEIGATGGSYGGGMSMALAALKDRVMLPDYSLVPWTSPVDHKPMQIAAATPDIPWTDLSYSLTPNGGYLDYVADSPYTGRFGVMKESYVNGLYLSGLTSGEGNYVTEGADDTADLVGWRNRLLAGEPYDGDPDAQDILDEISQHHSAYGIDHSQPPAPLLISSGITDDLFPPDEALRFYNRTTTEYPNSPISIFFGDFGHPRAKNKADVVAALTAREDAWMDFYVKGVGSAPPHQAELYTLTCPGTAPSGGPIAAPSWAKIAPGEVRFNSAAAQTVTASGGDNAVTATFDPITGPGACATAPAADQSGVASYRLPAAPAGGYTLVGSPTLLAQINSPTANSQLTARLLDVDTKGTASAADDTESLVARQLYRPDLGSTSQVFQLHPDAWHYDAGHIPKLELTPRDAGGGLGAYGRVSDGQGTITVSDLQLRLPVRESPGSLGGLVRAPAAKVLRSGQSLAAGFAALTPRNATLKSAKLKATGATVSVGVGSPAAWAACHATVKLFQGGGAVSSAKSKRLLIGKGKATIAGGRTKALKLKLSKRARKLIGKQRKLKTRVVIRTAEQAGTVQGTRRLLLPKAKQGSTGRPK